MVRSWREDLLPRPILPLRVGAVPCPHQQFNTHGCPGAPQLLKLPLLEPRTQETPGVLSIWETLFLSPITLKPPPPRAMDTAAAAPCVKWGEGRRGRMEEKRRSQGPGACSRAHTDTGREGWRHTQDAAPLLRPLLGPTPCLEEE